MRAWPVIVALVLFAPTEARAQAKSRKATASTVVSATVNDSASVTAVEKVVASMDYGYRLCPNEIQNAMLEQRLRLLRNQPGDAEGTVKAMHQCPDSAAIRTDSLFRIARGRRLSPEVALMLKDLFADWRANLPALQPADFDEAVVDGGRRYIARIADITREFTKKSERLKLELH
jgi:hypothetical protein